MSLCINPNCLKPENSDNDNYCQACGSDLVLVGKYRVIRLLSAKGGFANTYEVIDINHNTLKVVKVLTYNTPKAIDLFQKEAFVLSKLNHPGIPKGEGLFIFYSPDSQSPLYCLVMEKIEGLDLEEYQKQNHYQPIPQETALDWLLQLALILDTVHSRSFFHRDIKPSNIIVKPDNQLVLIDFGAVRQITGTILAGGKVTGIYTPGYAPPEQERGYAVPESDFFALGRTFVYLLTGKDPSDPEIYNHKENELQWRDHAPHISYLLADFLDKLMADKASDRPKNTQTIVENLTKIQQQLSSSSVGIPPTIIPNQQLALINTAPIFSRLQASFLDTIFSMSIAALIGYLATQYFLSNNYQLTFTNKSILSIHSSLVPALSTTLTGLIIVKLWLIADFFLHYKKSYFSYNFYMTLILLGVITKWLYFVLMEASWLQGTLGKLILKIKVTNLEGNPITLKQANQRYWIKFISSIMLYVGYLPIFSKKRQSLHDKVAGTLIVKKKCNDVK